ncbi:LysE family translocator [Acetobacter cerevisiae]|uniref:LysE family translocator n=1 Tax=Acetobacter cerevisiae TaxID=178900 RepID=UPI00209F04DB|nr:LysE family translocator [Acetobacter cerevisiae]MCP1271535.1 LysE family translocator [Acetobacter cerevisiae]MCP1279489.1 LysE family translocator [Acetobacter cerevisiae]
MNLHTLLAFWTISILLAATPGADWAYVISAGIRDHAAVIPAVFGLFLGYLAITATVAGGIGALVANMPLAITILTFAGAAYLIKLGISLLRHPPLPKEGHERETGARRWMTKGFAISGLNPKALLFFLALLPQFTNPGSAWPIFLQIGILGAIHTMNCMSIYLMVGFGARTILSSRPRASIVTGYISGAIMIILGLGLASEDIMKLLHS